MPELYLRDTGRNRARQVLSLLMESTVSLTAKEKPRTNASRSPRFISSLAHFICRYYYLLDLYTQKLLIPFID